jgi:hypothetical protein
LGPLNAGIPPIPAARLITDAALAGLLHHACALVLNIHSRPPDTARLSDASPRGCSSGLRISRFVLNCIAVGHGNPLRIRSGADASISLSGLRWACSHQSALYVTVALSSAAGWPRVDMPVAPKDTFIQALAQAHGTHLYTPYPHIKKLCALFPPQFRSSILLRGTFPFCRSSVGNLYFMLHYPAVTCFVSFLPPSGASVRDTVWDFVFLQW